MGKLQILAQRNERTIARDQVTEDIVGTVKFFVSPEQAFITEQTMIADGGVYFHDLNSGGGRREPTQVD